MADKEKIVRTVQSPDYREYYAIGALGRITEHDFRIGFYNKSVEVETEKDEYSSFREINTSIILPHQPMKELAIWMMKHYLGYEEKHGDLPLDEMALKNLIDVLEKLKKYDIEDLKLRLAETKKPQPKKTSKKNKRGQK